MRRAPMRRAPMPTLGLLLLCACGSSTDEPTLAADVQPILDRSCAVVACHGGAAIQADLSLEGPDAYGALVDAPSTQVPGTTRVVPGDPEASLLLQVLRGPIEADVPGEPPLVERMPRDMSQLPEADLAVIEAWIAAGAPE